MQRAVCSASRVAQAMLACTPRPVFAPTRCVHSKSYLKRKAKHPAARPPLPVAAEAVAVAPPTLPTQPLPALGPNGWLPAQGNGPADLPWKVSRAGPGKSMPVYRDYLSGRTRVVTVIRRAQGNLAAMAAEIRAVTGGAEVRIRPGRLEVEGDRKEQLSLWLMGLGL